VIEIENLSKSFHNIKALQDVSLHITSGQVLGVLGPNGAGKTTLFKLIAGFLYPDSGTIKPIASRWPRIGYKPERLLYPPKMRVRDLLSLSAQLCNIPQAQINAAVAKALQAVNLTSAANKRVSECSKGMRQRLGLAQALLGDPSLLLLDEPSNGLDPEGQDEIQGLIHGLRQAGKTVVLSTHQLHEVTQVCTDLVILKRGQIHYQNTMSGALAERPHATVWLNRDATPMQPLLTSLHPDIRVEGQLVTLNQEALTYRRQVLSLLLAAGYDVTRLQQKRVTLPEIYGEVVRT